MKSPLYLLTVLLPLTLAMSSAEPDDTGDDSVEERDHRKDPPHRHPPWCQSDHPIWYYKFPCPPAGKYDRHDKVHYQCKRDNWYKTSNRGNTWWVKENDVPWKCRNKPNC